VILIAVLARVAGQRFDRGHAYGRCERAYIGVTRRARARAGEINTLQGNLNWVASREHSLTAPVWKGREPELLPLCNASESDSANLDHVAELLMRTGVAATQARRRGRLQGLGGLGLWAWGLPVTPAWHIIADNGSCSFIARLGLPLGMCWQCVSVYVLLSSRRLLCTPS